MSVRAPHRRAVVAGLAPLAILVAMLGAAPLAQASTSATTGQASHSLQASGSDTTYAMMQKLDALYAGQHGCSVVPADAAKLPDGTCQANYTGTAGDNATHDTVTEMYPVGSGAGIKQLCQQGLAGVPTVDFARSSRAIKDSDCDGLKAVAYAQDGISWWHSTAATSSSKDLHNLTRAQLVNIYNGTDKKWSDVDPTLPATDIVVYSVQAGSGTRSTFDGYLGIDSTQAIPAANKPGGTGPSHVIFENDASPIFANGDADNAIYFYSIGRFTQRASGSTPPQDVTGGELGQLDGVSADTAHVKDGTFPATRKLFNVYRYPSAAVIDYIGEKTGFLCRSDISADLRAKIEQQITGEGFVPFSVGSIGGGVSGSSYCRLTQTIDSTQPSVALTSSAGYRGVAAAVFSEPVTGVAASTFGVRVAGSTTPLAGALTCFDLQQRATACSGAVKSARFLPSANYVPGQNYEAFATPAIADRSANPLSTTPAVAFRGPLTVQDTDSPAVAYSAGWSRVAWAGASGGTYTRSSGTNTSLSSTFRGTGITYTWVRTTSSGVARVYVDGVLKATVNQYGSSAVSSTPIRGLVDKAHTIKVVVTGTKSAASHGVMVTLDRFMIS